MTETDLRDVLKIEKCVFPHPWSANFFRLIISDRNNIMVTLRLFDRCIGYGGYHILTKNVTFPLSHLKNYSHVVHIINIAIDLPFQHKGYGGYLLSYLLSDAKKRGAKYSYLEVRPSNERAITLYRRFGFSMVGIIENYYPHEHENALVMGKEL